MSETEFTTGLIPELMTVGLDEWRFHTVHDDAAIIGQYRQHLRHDFLQVAAVTANEDGVGMGKLNVEH